MSLKAFHIFFILCSVALALGFGVWEYNQYAVSQDSKALLFAAAGLISSVGLAGYLIWFLKKMKKSS